MGGKWGGRRLRASAGDGLRPTAGRVKQAVFSLIESHRM
ncbi:MAG: RsmD family RNA methyltransferase, partial [Bdellovibrionales bacterium]|nr:RsmD family RNA methyltransferase [Bdellovibrionales bacterium]